MSCHPIETGIILKVKDALAGILLTKRTYMESLLPIDQLTGYVFVTDP
jgi:hypothetical protein